MVVTSGRYGIFMRVRSGPYGAVLYLLFLANSLSAQKVMYSPFIGDPSVLKFEVLAKAGEYYWIQKGKKKDSERLPTTYGIRDREQSFEIYDARMKPIRTVPFEPVAVTAIKEYFISDARYFDRLILITDYHQTSLYLQRYSPDGTILYDKKMPYSFPFNEIANCFLMARSEDQSKVLLLGFETTPQSIQRVHAKLFNRDWKLLSDNVFEHPYISQPTIQYEFFNYPIEHFSNSPIKLANNGQWLMAVPSRSNHNFLLFHFNGEDSEFIYKEIRLPQNANVESVALSVDNSTNEVLAGILSRLRSPSLKSVSVAHYSLQKRELDFDSSYKVNTVAGDKPRNDNLVEEDFIALPGAGFMLLKEYGRTYSGDYRSEQFMYDDRNDQEQTIANQSKETSAAQFYRGDDYTRYNSLGISNSRPRRGDLDLYYFPADKSEQCWSGIISKEQVTELNSSFLSYFIVPMAKKFVFLYNAKFRRADQFGSTTILDQAGNPVTDAGILFWDVNNTLLFQKARQIAVNEVVVPYERNQREGFAVIRF